jgi:hypothetical protein
VGDTTIGTGETAQFTAMKVTWQSPLVLLVKVVWRGCKTFESGYRYRWNVEQWQKLSRVPLHLIRTPNSGIKPREGSLW